MRLFATASRATRPHGINALGLILDSSVFIAGERRGETVRQIISRVWTAFGNVECALSVISALELTHGIYRAKSDVDRMRRRAFTDDVLLTMVVHPVSLAIARLAGRIEGEQAAMGISIAVQDLIIGTTALHLGFGVVTLNVRHFKTIPGLRVESV
jgi:tRNA(fMet)-specific endonuclease VapC